MAVNRNIGTVETPIGQTIPKTDISAVPPGYIRSDFGLVPHDWDCVTIGDMGEVLTGKALARNAPGRQRPYLRTKNVFDGRIDVEDVLTMPMTDAQFEHFSLHSGDVLLNEGQSLELVGRCAIYRDEYPETCAIQNQLLRFRAFPGVSGEFAAQLFRHCQSTGVFARIALQTTSIAHLGGSRFAALKLSWPRIESEQSAIAEALSDVDESLRVVEALIVKKRNLRQATMLHLLTGTIRLPGFRREWKTIRLGDHVTFLRHGVNSRAELTPDGPVKYLHYGDIHTISDVYLDPHIRSMPSLPVGHARTLDRLQQGDLVLVDASEDLDGIGKSVELRLSQADEVVSGLHTIAARFDKAVLADGFKAYLQFCPAFRQHLRRLAAGTKVFATNRAHVATVEIQLPRCDEQISISTVISDMGRDVAALEARRNKIRDIKNGMMQQLLAGRIRLAKPTLKKTAA